MFVDLLIIVHRAGKGVEATPDILQREKRGHLAEFGFLDIYRKVEW